MAAFAKEHADARKDLVAFNGQILAFVRETPGIYNPIDDTWTDVPDTTIPGVALAVKGNPDVYAAEGLVLSTMPTLRFVPDAYPLRAHTPEFVMPNDKVLWNGRKFSAERVFPNAPDGAVIASKVVISV